MIETTILRTGIRWVAGGRYGDGTYEGISQLLSQPLVPNQMYLLSAVLRRTTSGDSAPGGYDVFLSPSTNTTNYLQTAVRIGSLGDATSSTSWQEKNLSFSAPTNAQSLIYFLLVPYVTVNDGHTAYNGIDNLSLMPQGNEDLLASIHFSAVDICWAGRTNQMYQVQFRTNISETNWFALGSPVPGTGTNCLTDSFSGMGQRFYRVTRTP